MPVYRNEDYLTESIRSILNQTCKDLEFIILCDNPSDKIKAIIGDFMEKDNRIRVVYHERKGLVASLNEGISLSCGTFIARMDSDDISYPDRLEKQVAFMEAHPECALVATQVEWIDESGNFMGYWKTDLDADSAKKIKEILPRECCLAHPTILFRRSTAHKYPYDPCQVNVEDYDVWLRMASDNLVLCKLPETLLKLRIHPSSITSLRRIESPGSDKIMCKARYLTVQLCQGKISIFNLKVFFYLLIHCIIWPIRKIQSLMHNSIISK